MSTTTLLVRHDHLATTRLAHTDAAALAEGQVRVRVDRFALTANNITYAAMGGMLNYWKFYPAAKRAGGLCRCGALAAWSNRAMLMWRWASACTATGPCPTRQC